MNNSRILIPFKIQGGFNERENLLTVNVDDF